MAHRVCLCRIMGHARAVVFFWKKFHDVRHDLCGTHAHSQVKISLYLMVYDVTPFMDEHPGGDEVMLAATGKDATNDFEDVGHSDSARDLMHKYFIGEIDASTVPSRRSYVPPQQAPYNPDKTSDFVVKILQFLVPIMILGLAFGVRYYTKAE